VTLPKTITLDGPAGAGKSSIAFAVARELDYLLVDTGAFYRAVTLAALRAGVVESDETAIVDTAQNLHLDITPDLAADERHYTMLLNGEDVTWAIRSMEVEAYVSRVAAMVGVRDVLNQSFRKLAAAHERVIMVGRDIGTVVLPTADLKIYLDASLDVRAKRRHKQSTKGQNALALGDTQAALAGRDRLDSQRPVAPLRPAPDAHLINTDKLDAQAVTDQVFRLIHEWHPMSS
jgi:cytidylate kinase